MSPYETEFWQAVGRKMILDAIQHFPLALDRLRDSIAHDAAHIETWDTCTKVCNDAARAVLAQYDHLFACS